MASFDRVQLKATHNSYSGDINGRRGTLVEQLRCGVRSFELDIHADNFAASGDYAIGHDYAGDEVWNQGSNPSTWNFRDWAGQIATFSRQNPPPGPLHLVLDIKSSLNLPSAGIGNHGALNAALLDLFGAQLVRASHVRDWPNVDLLRGRILVILSGDAPSRAAYSIDRGITPAVAMNSHGQVIEVHESEAGNHKLWYWTGQLETGGSVRWQRHGRYGRGTTPAVALNDDGWIVEVHKSEHHDRLWYYLGRLGADLDVTWLSNHDYDDGILPTIRFDQSSAFTLREIHRSQAHDRNWDWSVTVDPTSPTLGFNFNTQTTDPRWTAAIARPLAVQTIADNVLVYSSNVIERSPICYEQLAFVEYQADDDLVLGRGVRFTAADAGDETFLVNSRLSGRVTRAWQFLKPHLNMTPPPNCPATDEPFSDWYTTYCQQIGVVT